jgi:POT family proton-dependent oligopeptide transporter
MTMLPSAAATAPASLSAFTPLLVAVALWAGFVVWGLWGLRAHPRGLNLLFFTEMWERFSYYGMRALLLLYMTRPAAAGGLGLPLTMAGVIYAAYTFSVYALNVPGGLIADRVLGQRKAIQVGAAWIAAGEFSLAAGPRVMFYAGLVVIALGTGLLKANCTSVVGMLYKDNDPRRDAGYSLYYMGINIGALVAPLILGFMAQDPVFVAALGRVGLASANGWRWGFGVAGAAMVAGLIQYSLRQGILGEAGLGPGTRAEEAGARAVRPPLTAEERSRLGVVVILLVFITTFFFVFDQAGTTLNLFAYQHTRTSVAGWTFPSVWFQSVGSVWVVLLSPVFAWLWVRLGTREPSSLVKFTFGLFFVGLGMLLLVPPSRAITADPTLKVAPYWLVGVYFLHTVGELCLSPVALSAVSKLAPARYAGVMMGVLFLANGSGNMLAGLAGAFSENLAPVTLFGGLFVITTLMAILLALLTPRIKVMMAGVR